MAGVKVTKRSSGELERLLKRVRERLRFHHDRCMRLAAISGAIEAELSRRRQEYPTN